MTDALAPDALALPLGGASLNDCLWYASDAMSEQPAPSPRRAPGILRLLPPTLPFYPYRPVHDTNRRVREGKKRQRHDHDAEKARAIEGGEGGESSFVLDQPLCGAGIATATDAGFTLFFFVDSTNRQSLRAIPSVSRWFHHALSGREGGNNRIVCIPNQPSPGEINLRDSHSDPLVQASVNSSMAPRQQSHSMLSDTGFYHLPFLDPKRLPLLHLLGATRVPCVIVVGNGNGRIVTRYGWEAIQREENKLEQWIESSWVENKKHDGGVGCDDDGVGEGSMHCFDSMVVRDWSNGKSGMPWWFALAFWG